MKNGIADKVRAAGVVGAGGAGFPTHVKLSATVERVLANGASCEPLLKSDPYLMEHEPETILRGLQLAMEATGARLGTVCIKEKHHGALRAIKDLIQKGTFKNIDLFELGDFYPAGDEQVLVYEVMRRVVPEGGIPLQVGAVVCNVESLLNIARAVDHHEPVTERYLTVTGEVARPAIVKVPIGTRISDVINAVGGAKLDDYRVVVGGPMMGQVVSDPNTPVNKTTSGIILLPPDHNVVVAKVKDPARLRHLTKVVCCQCTRCTDLCPRNLLGHSLKPHTIMRQLGASPDVAAEVMKDALICSECGVCEKYACPMMISPREVNIQIKRELLQKGIKRAPKVEDYRVSAFRDVRRIPTSRLMERLRVKQYEDHPDLFSGKIEPPEVIIPLKQHIGAPAFAVVKKGDSVKRGDLIGEIPEKALGARVHASMEGTVLSVDANVRIQRKQ
jgi:Na+-translocating ferredoxin:NAD+ oxidoreductase RnfC subunit